MKSGIFVNLLQSIFAIKTVYSVKNQKPAEFLNSCLLLFGVVTVGMILYRNGLNTKMVSKFPEFAKEIFGKIFLN